MDLRQDVLILDAATTISVTGVCTSAKSLTFMQVVTLDDIYASSDIRYCARFISMFFVLKKIYNYISVKFMVDNHIL